MEEFFDFARNDKEGIFIPISPWPSRAQFLAMLQVLDDCRRHTGYTFAAAYRA
jgi:hypothetical protein